MTRLNKYLNGPVVATEAVEEPEFNVRDQLVSILGSGDQAKVDRLLMIVEGYESYDDLSDYDQLPSALPELSFEGFNAKEFITRIVQWIKKWVEYLTDDNTAFRVTASNMRVSLDHLNMRNSSGVRVGSTKPLVLKEHIAALSTMYNPPSSINDVISGLRNRKVVLEGYSKYLKNNVVPAVKEVTRIIKTLDLSRDNYPEVVKRIVTQMRKADPVEMTRTIGSTLNTAFTHHARPMVSSPHMIGNQRLLITTITRDYDLGYARQSSMRVERSLLKPKPIPTEITIPRTNNVTTGQCITTMRETLDVIAGLIDDSTTRKQTLDDLAQALEGFAGRVDRQTLPATSEDQVKEIQSVCRTLTGWTTVPYRSLIGGTNQSLKGGIALCYANLR